ncbi:MAG TPA: PIN domain nuclease [Deltaproteobacteria bacterium]|nr:MAG: twitching motility protein PilT [Deltaproteobacteria bacterium RIFOXYA2_FULL_55_11]HBA38879.1 PIN domain nuclease [Deltaproteobacteria bacterium]
MSDLVVDASVAIKWFLPEIHGEAALRLLEGQYALRVPDLIFSEFGNVLWKRFRKGQISRKEAIVTTEALLALPLQVESSQSLIPAALEIACSAHRTVYDSLYLAVAIAHQCRVVTADSKLHNALKKGALSAHLLWVEDIPR